MTIDRDRRALKYIDDISADQQIPVYFFLLQAFRYLVLLLLVSRSRTTFVPFNGESVLPEPIIPPSISFPALVTDSSTHHQTPSTTSKNEAPPQLPTMGLELPQSPLYNNLNPFDNLLFIFLKTSPGTLATASLIGSILQSFICGILTVLVR